MRIEVISLFKGVFLVFLALLVLTQFTDADLYDLQIISDNVFTASTLDFSNRDTANNQPNSLLFNVSGLIPNGFQVRSIRVKKDGRLNFQYHVKMEKTAGNDQLCHVLEIMVMQNWQIKAQGPLTALSLNSAVSEARDYDDWVFFLLLAEDEPSLINLTCDFNLVFRSWRESPGDSIGFWDEEILLNHVTTGSWSINGT